MNKDEKRRMVAAGMQKVLNGDIEGAKQIQRIIESIEEDEAEEQDTE